MVVLPSVNVIQGLDPPALLPAVAARVVADPE
jgi:hypothetical protein